MSLPAEIPAEDGVFTPPLHAVEATLHEIAHATVVPKELRSRNAKDQIRHAFELIGGIPRLAQWAHQNPGDFYRIWSKTIPSQITGENGGPLQVHLSWLNARDTSGRASPPTTIDVTPT